MTATVDPGEMKTVDLVGMNLMHHLLVRGDQRVELKMEEVGDKKKKTERKLGRDLVRMTEVHVAMMIEYHVIEMMMIEAVIPGVVVLLGMMDHQEDHGEMMNGV